MSNSRPEGNHPGTSQSRKPYGKYPVDHDLHCLKSDNFDMLVSYEL